MNRDTERFLQSVIQAFWRDRNSLALNLVSKPRKILERPSSPSNITLRLSARLSLIRRLQPRKLVRVLPHQTRKLGENSPSLRRIHVAPFRRSESIPSRINSGFRVVLGRPRDLRNNLPIRWIENRGYCATSALLPV